MTHPEVLFAEKTGHPSWIQPEGKCCDVCGNRCETIYENCGCNNCCGEIFSDSWSEDKAEYTYAWDEYENADNQIAELSINCPECGAVCEKIVYTINMHNYKDNTNTLGCENCIVKIEY